MPNVATVQPRHTPWTSPWWLCPVLLLSLTACTAVPAPSVPVVYADPAEAVALAGRWWGDYGSVESGRHGRVRFTLETDDDVEATGDVLMVPNRVIDAGNVFDADRPPTPTALRVRFVQIEGNTVLGTLEPYNDPECGCLVSTTFHGELNGDSIEGTYVSQGGRQHLGHSGRWRVERQVEDDPG